MASEAAAAGVAGVASGAATASAAGVATEATVTDAASVASEAGTAGSADAAAMLQSAPKKIPLRARTCCNAAVSAEEDTFEGEDVLLCVTPDTD